MNTTELNATLSEHASATCENGIPNWTDNDFFYVLGQKTGAYLAGAGFLNTQPQWWQKDNLNASVDKGVVVFYRDGEKLPREEQVPTSTFALAPAN